MDQNVPADDDRTTLVKSDRTDRETFFYLTMSADLTQIKQMGAEMTEDELRAACKENGVPEAEITRQLENARAVGEKNKTTHAQ